MKNELSLFAQRLKDLRSEGNYTLEEFSKKLDLPAQTINRYELDQRTPKIDTVDQIASKLNVSSDYLLGKTDYKNWEELASNITQLESLESYISSLGYKIEPAYQGAVSGSSQEESERLAMEADSDPNFPTWKVTTKQGNTFIVSLAEHEQLTNRVKNMIEYELQNIETNGYFIKEEKKTPGAANTKDLDCNQ
ncbi:putative transcriptional regulator [Clostridium sartagoforme AAU1]|uniref:Putative transcriptional regulator n=1 Tax=Clostridium sartagoforme AAU1 TaxID=1202534 RepID=R9C7N9_9CLOT|nr:helix-turn-helix transcriptional regulator [Clostridium sartagoforme]EOR25322.1 putative transcriptional regulator [Clostridium sartagoforme AAU1]